MKWVPLLATWPLLAISFCAGPLSVHADELAEHEAPDEHDALDGHDELEDVLGGFEDEESDAFDVDVSDEAVDEEVPAFDLDGSIEFSPSVNFLSHSAPGPNGPVSYTGFSRLRTRLNLQLDFNLARDWKLRIAGYVFGDPIYAIRGRDDYTQQVLDEFEWEIDFSDFYLQGEVLPNFDMKVGRQVVIWGRSDSIRVLDVLNPLDNREPGRVDIEDIRLPTAMVKLDYYLGSWSFSAIAIPELRFPFLPPFGSDFGPKVPFENVEPTTSFENTEWALAVTGTFSGWDISFHGARIWDDFGYAVIDPTQPVGFHTEHARLWMAGAGGNYTLGEWLFKGELAWFDGLRFARSDPKSRLDALIGIEYYGFHDTTIALEYANRHLFDFEPQMTALPDLASENVQEVALRYTADFLNARLHVTILGQFFGWDASGGAVIRLSADYDLRDALVVGGGILIYAAGEVPPFSNWGRNDRIFAQIKYSF